MNEIKEFERKCIESWGSNLRNSNQFHMGIPGIQDFINKEFRKLTPELKIHITEKLIKESKKEIIQKGSGRTIIFKRSKDVSWYLKNFAYDIQPINKIFNAWRWVAIQSSVLMLSQEKVMLHPSKNDCDHIISGGKAPATLYLLSQLEYILRIKCRYLNEEGIVIENIPLQLIKKIDRTPEKVNINETRINQIHQTFLLYLYSNTCSLAKKLNQLDKYVSISNRLKDMRSPAMHGYDPDISHEGYLYALIIAMFYYSENKD